MDNPMRTNIIINDTLMKDALNSSGLKTKKEAVEAGLRLLIQFNTQKELKKLRGKISWEGNLDEMRSNT